MARRRRRSIRFYMKPAAAIIWTPINSSTFTRVIVWGFPEAFKEWYDAVSRNDQVLFGDELDGMVPLGIFLTEKTLVIPSFTRRHKYLVVARRDGDAIDTYVFRVTGFTGNDRYVAVARVTAGVPAVVYNAFRGFVNSLTDARHGDEPIRVYEKLDKLVEKILRRVRFAPSATPF